MKNKNWKQRLLKDTQINISNSKKAISNSDEISQGLVEGHSDEFIVPQNASSNNIFNGAVSIAVALALILGLTLFIGNIASKDLPVGESSESSNLTTTSSTNIDDVIEKQYNMFDVELINAVQRQFPDVVEKRFSKADVEKFKIEIDGGMENNDSFLNVLGVSENMVIYCYFTYDSDMVKETYAYNIATKENSVVAKEVPHRTVASTGDVKKYKIIDMLKFKEVFPDWNEDEEIFFFSPRFEHRVVPGRFEKHLGDPNSNGGKTLYNYWHIDKDTAILRFSTSNNNKNIDEIQVYNLDTNKVRASIAKESDIEPKLDKETSNYTQQTETIKSLFCTENKIYIEYHYQIIETSKNDELVFWDEIYQVEVYNLDGEVVNNYPYPINTDATAIDGSFTAVDGYMEVTHDNSMAVIIEEKDGYLVPLYKYELGVSGERRSIESGGRSISYITTDEDANYTNTIIILNLLTNKATSYKFEFVDEYKELIRYKTMDNGDLLISCYLKLSGKMEYYLFPADQLL